jgi:hypothetical protein
MIGLRVPPELKTALEEAAERSDRTLAAECERRLRRSFNVDEILADAVALLERGFHEPDVDLADHAQRTREVAQRALTLLYGAEYAALAVDMLVALTVLRSANSMDTTDSMRNVLRRAGVEQLNRVKAAIRRVGG